MKDLLEVSRTEPLIKEVVVSDLSPSCNLMLGIGLANCKVSDGLPFDSLGMVFVAEFLKRELNLGKNYLLIADSCALQNGVDKEQLNRLAQKEKAIFERIVDQFENWEIFRASELEEGNREFDEILDSVRRTRVPEKYRQLQDRNREPFPNEYVSKQLSEMRLLRTRSDTKIKVGWKMPGSTFDERVFDSLYTEIFGQDMSFVYVECGKTLNPEKPNAPPYLSGNSRERIILDVDEKVVEKVELSEEKATKDYRAFLGRISGLYKKLICGFTAEETAQKIIDRVCYGIV